MGRTGVTHLTETKQHISTEPSQGTPTLLPPLLQLFHKLVIQCGYILEI